MNKESKLQRRESKMKEVEKVVGSAQQWKNTLFAWTTTMSRVEYTTCLPKPYTPKGKSWSSNPVH